MDTAPNPNDSLTITQAAKLLGCSAQSLRLWESQGRIRPSYRTLGGGHRRYYRRDIDELIAKRDNPHAAHQAQTHHDADAG